MADESTEIYNLCQRYDIFKYDVINWSLRSQLPQVNHDYLRSTCSTTSIPSTAFRRIPWCSSFQRESVVHVNLKDTQKTLLLDTEQTIPG